MRRIHKLSRYFLPVLKETTDEGRITSHRLMLRAGMIQQSSAGIYSWLPLGLRVMDKIEAIVREEQNRAGAHEILMPTIQPAEIWQESGRYDDYGSEMLRIKDCKEKEMLYGPTNEEQVTDIFRRHVKSYRSLPLNLYHIQWKFRDEPRPRFGVMRGREFLMKDAYSFALDKEGALTEYKKMFVSYLKIFERLGLTAIPMKADTGPIGGDMSHEFVILAKAGESEVFCHKDWLEMEYNVGEVKYDSVSNLENKVKRFTKLYAATDDEHNPDTCGVAPEDLVTTRGIEVGHIFYFGTKYSAPMEAEVKDKNGEMVSVHMGSYGIGVSRLVGGIIEASHDDRGIIWPQAVAPFDIMVVNLKVGNEDCDSIAKEICVELSRRNKDVLFDDSEESFGAKLATADLIGIPYQVIIGPRALEEGKVEVKVRKSDETHKSRPNDVIDLLWDIGFFKRKSP